MDLGGQREKLCLPSSFCEKPPQLWHCPPRGCSTTACPAPLPLPDHPPRTVQVSFKAQMQEDAHFPTSYWSSKSSSSLSCSLGNSSQHLDSTSQKSAFKKCQPSAAPGPRGKAPRDTESCGKLQTGSLPSTAPQRDVGGPRSIFSPSQTQQKQQWEELGGGPQPANTLPLSWGWCAAKGVCWHNNPQLVPRRVAGILSPSRWERCLLCFPSRSLVLLGARWELLSSPLPPQQPHPSTN